MIRFLTATQAGCRRSFPRHLLHRIAAPAITVVAALVAQVIYPQPVHARSSDHPNIVYILADDLGYAELGCYGQEKIKTPNIDRIAREGMRFTQHYCGNAVCAPSRCVLMTGKHPGHAYVRNNGNPKGLDQLRGRYGWEFPGQNPIPAGLAHRQALGLAHPRGTCLHLTPG